MRGVRMEQALKGTDVGPGTMVMSNLMMTDRPKIRIPGQKGSGQVVVFSFWAMPPHVVSNPDLWRTIYMPVDEHTQNVRDATYATVKGSQRLVFLMDIFTSEALDRIDIAIELEEKGLGIAGVRCQVTDKAAFRAKCLAIQAKIPKAPPQ